MTEAPIELASGAVADLGAVMKVMNDSFDPRFGESWTSAQCAGLLAMPGVWLTLARSPVSGAEGFSLSRVIADEAELLLLAVRQQSQRRGIGSLLLQDFIGSARGRGAQRLHLEVREGNPAIELYSRAGFNLAGRRRNYYSGSDGRTYDALTLARVEPA
jgi:ribosomal-protein-alanine N-acetyltransferase